MKILVLDDSHERQKVFAKNLIGHEKVIHALSYQQAIEALNEDVFDLIYIDHDLGENDASPTYNEFAGPVSEYNGADVAKYIVEMDEERYPKKVIIQSFNPIGANNIFYILQDVGIDVEKEPFHINIGLEYKE